MKVKQAKSKDKLLLFLVLLGVFFLPFNSYQGLSFLGEFSKDSCTLFFILAFFVLFIYSLFSGKIRIPLKNPLFQILLAFNIWLIFSTLLNLTEISTYYFKQTSGLSRSLRQYFALYLSGIFFLLTYYNAFVSVSYKTLFFKIRKVLSYSFIIVSIYAIIEILILKFNYSGLEPILNLFDYFPFTNIYLDIRNFRISAVTFEPPALATYLFTISGWMFSYILTGKGLKKYIPAIWTLTLALFSGSRAALLIIFIQLFVFLIMLMNKKHINTLKQIIRYAIFLLFILFAIKGKTITNYFIERATSFQVQDDEHAVSNKSRFGIQYTNFLVFLEKPVAGAGLGQQAFIAKDMYPDWATEDNWEFSWMYLNEDVKAFPPGYNIYIRLLAETGVIGLAIFIIFLIAILFVTIRIIKFNNDKQLLAIVILVSMFGLIFNWLKMDTFRVFGFWIHFALLLVISKDVVKISRHGKS